MSAREEAGGVFTYGGITIRVVEPHDLDRIRRLRNDPSTWINLTDVQLITAPMEMVRA